MQFFSRPLHLSGSILSRLPTTCGPCHEQEVFVSCGTKGRTVCLVTGGTSPPLASSSSTATTGHFFRNNGITSGIDIQLYGSRVGTEHRPVKVDCGELTGRKCSTTSKTEALLSCSQGAFKNTIMLRNSPGNLYFMRYDPDAISKPLLSTGLLTRDMIQLVTSYRRFSSKEGGNKRLLIRQLIISRYKVNKLPFFFIYISKKSKCISK